MSGTNDELRGRLPCGAVRVFLTMQFVLPSVSCGAFLRERLRPRLIHELVVAKTTFPSKQNEFDTRITAVHSPGVSLTFLCIQTCRNREHKKSHKDSGLSRTVNY